MRYISAVIWKQRGWCSIWPFHSKFTKKRACCRI